MTIGKLQAGWHLKYLSLPPVADACMMSRGQVNRSMKGSREKAHIPVIVAAQTTCLFLQLWQGFEMCSSLQE